MTVMPIASAKSRAVTPPKLAENDGLKFQATVYNTIFQKLHFSKSPFSEIPQEKYDHVTIWHSVSLKKCHKIFENWLTNKNFMPERFHKCEILKNAVSERGCSDSF